jgi:hypothetical protein
MFSETKSSALNISSAIEVHVYLRLQFLDKRQVPQLILLADINEFSVEVTRYIYDAKAYYNTKLLTIYERPI